MEATPKMNRSAKGGARSSLHDGGEVILIHPPYQGWVREGFQFGLLFWMQDEGREPSPVKAGVAFTGRLNARFYVGWQEPR
jgi:hypothetical protein